MIVDTLSEFCIHHDIITTEDLPMFRYCIEKRLLSAILLCPLFFLGIQWTNVSTTLSFLCAFSYLRSTTNGFHAAKPRTCFIFSVLIELLLFKYVIPRLNILIVVITIPLSVVAIFALAPFNHPNMDLSPEEINACRTESRKRLIILLFFLLTVAVLSWIDIFVGLFLGIALVSVLLCLAYISNLEVLLCSTKRMRS